MFLESEKRMKIVFASNNPHKIKELSAILKSELPNREIELLSPADVGIVDEIEENGVTFEENALIKAKACAQKGYISIADDSGLEVDALGGQPGVYSARFAGRHGDDEANNEKLLHMLKGTPKGQRTARYVCVMACVIPGGKALTAKGIVNGAIIEQPRGSGGFGYDPAFCRRGRYKNLGANSNSTKKPDFASGQSDPFISGNAERLFGVNIYDHKTKSLSQRACHEY